MSKNTSLFQKDMLQAALKQSFLKLNPKQLFRNPVMFTVEIGTAVILYGADEKPTPTGELSIREKLKDHRSNTYDAPMPYTMRLTDDGVAIHGSNVRWGAATHGCIGVPLDFAAKLFEQVKVGDPVVIIPARRKPKTA